MAEFCRDCFIKLNGLAEDQVRIELSDPDDLDLCEGCGQWTRVVVDAWISKKSFFLKND